MPLTCVPTTGGQVDTFALDFEKAFDTPLMNYLKANYLVMTLAEKKTHSGGEVPSFVAVVSG